MEKKLIMVCYGDYWDDGHGKFKPFIVESPVKGKVLGALIESVIKKHGMEGIGDGDTPGMETKTYENLLFEGKEYVRKNIFSSNPVSQAAERHEIDLEDYVDNEESEFYVSVDFLHDIIKFLLEIDFDITIKNREIDVVDTSLGYSCFM